MARLVYYKTVEHEGLGKSRVISGSDLAIVEAKAAAQWQTWDVAYQNRQTKLWERENRQEAIEARKKDVVQAKGAAAQAKEAAATYKRSRQEEAAIRTDAAQLAIQAIRTLLAHTLSVNDVVDWSKLRYNKAPVQASRLTEPALVLAGRCPERSDPEFNAPLAAPDGLKEKLRRPYWGEARFLPQLGVVKRLLTSQKECERLARAACDVAIEQWRLECQQIERHNFQLLAAHQAQHEAAMQASFDAALAHWQDREQEARAENAKRLAQHAQAVQAANEQFSAQRTAYENEKAQHDALVETRRAAYEALEPGAVCDYFDLVLGASRYPDDFPQEWEMEYLPDSKMLVLDYCLPAPQDLPRVKEVRYVAAQDDFSEVLLRDTEVNTLYDEALYQMALRTLHEIFESDYAGSVDAAVFNGVVQSLDRSTGQDVRACVLSLQAGREEFVAINLARVEPKACFKMLKGVGSSALHSLAPVPPIIKLDTADARFVQAYGVADSLDESTNLAAMDWEDFEHLVREVFEKEFGSTGAMVKVTRASRDGGVDAVAFDPDPIRGGKIVIQAKRYANTVGVSAVRDLYGTVMNEGAIKGILVSTANYGPDAYEFANGKPLTLLNGANLLHLLARHGHRATIDLQAARNQPLKSRAPA